MKKWILLSLILLFAIPVSGQWADFIIFDRDTVFIDARGYPIKARGWPTPTSFTVADTAKIPVLLTDDIYELTSGGGIDIWSDATFNANVTMSQEVSETFLVVSDDADSVEINPKDALYVLRYSDGGVNRIMGDSLANFLLTSATTNSPTLKLTNTTDDATGGAIHLISDRASPADADVAGDIVFRASDGGGTQTNIVSIIGSIVEVDDAEEIGKLQFNVFDETDATGALQDFLSMSGGNSGAATQALIEFNADQKDVDLEVNTSALGNVLIVEGSSGEVGIGGVPQAFFHINPERDSGGDQDEDSTFVVTDRGWGMFGGIDPTYMLEVAGDVGINGGLYHNDDINTFVRFQSDIVDIVAGGFAMKIRNGAVGIGNQDPDDFITAISATPVFTLTDSDINLVTSSSSEQQDSAAIVLDASQTNPQIKWRGADGVADSWELTGNTDDEFLIQNATGVNVSDAYITTTNDVTGDTAFFDTYSHMFGNCVTVMKSGGDYTTVQAAIDYAATQTPTAASRWTILIYPGVYDEAITMHEYVDLKGVGTKTDVVIYKADAAVITLADSVEISNLTVRTGATGDIYCFQDDGVVCLAKIMDVHMESTYTGAGGWYGFMCTAAGDYTFERCSYYITATAGGTGDNAGFISFNAAATIRVIDGDFYLAGGNPPTSSKSHLGCVSVSNVVFITKGNRFDGDNACNTFYAEDGTFTSSNDVFLSTLANQIAAGATVTITDGFRSYEVDDDDLLLFTNLEDDTYETFGWDEGDSRFELSDDLDLAANNFTLTGDIASTGARANLIWADTVHANVYDGTALTIGASGSDATVNSDNLVLGATNITMTGSIAETASRVTKLWATAVEVASAAGLTINGNQINSDALSDVASIAMLDEDETVTGRYEFNDLLTVSDSLNVADLTVSTGEKFKVGTTMWTMAATDSIDGEVIGANTVDDDAIDWADVTGADIDLTDAGVITANGAFTSPGIDDNADAIAITIDVTTEEVNFSGLIDGDGTSGTANNTLADTLEITGNVSATTYGSDGTVTDAKLLYINTLSSNAQDQFDAKAPIASPLFTTQIAIGDAVINEDELEVIDDLSTTRTQLNYLSQSTGVTGTNTTNIVFSTSPTLVTPVLGAASATTLELTGNTIELPAGVTQIGTGATDTVSFTGPVGIGTATPGSKLDVRGVASVYAIEAVAHTTGGLALLLRGSGTSDNILSMQGYTDGTTQLFSIRTNSGTAVHMNTQNGKRLALGVSAAATVGSIEEHLNIISGGNVGIGTTSPAKKLHVMGDVAIGDTANATTDRFLYFAIDASVTTEYLKWDEGDDRFELSDALTCDSVYTTKAAAWADYVYEPEYELHSINAELEYQKENKHLRSLMPNNPEQKLVTDGDIQRRLEGAIAEIEKLYLFIEQQQRQIEQLQQGR